MDNWFYNKKITLLSENGHMEKGSWITDGYSTIETINCDIQPANRESIFKEYGYYIDCSYRLFADLNNNIDVGGYLQYNNQIFNIVKVIKWDDYIDFFVKERS